MKPTRIQKRFSGLAIVAIALTACAGVPQVTTLHAPSPSAATPYENILVVSLFSSFDARRYFEKETVNALQAQGTNAVALTSLLDPREPINRDTLLPVINDIDADAVLVTQVSNLQTTGKLKTRRPQSTHNVRQTYYYNVFSVELTEYVEPPAMQYQFDLALRADLFSVESRESVWAVASKTKDKSDIDESRDYSRFVDQATAIVRALERDRLIVK